MFTAIWTNHFHNSTNDIPSSNCHQHHHHTDADPQPIIDVITTPKDQLHHHTIPSSSPLSSPISSPSSLNSRLSSSPSSPTPSNEQLEKARKAGKYLQLLLHCQRCNGQCNNPVMCKHAKLLYSHSSKCSFTQCPIAGCHQTKKLLQHFTLCRWERKKAKLCGNEIKECLVCSFIGYDDQLHHDHQQTINHPSHDQEFTIPLPPKRLRDESYRISLNNLNDCNENDEEDEEEDDLTSICRYRSVSHAPDNLGLTNRSTRTGSI